MKQFPVYSMIMVLVFLLAGAVWSLPADRYGPDVQVTERSFSRLALTDLLWTQDVLLEVRAMSRVDCSHKCVATQGCVLLTFHPSPPGPPHPCRLYTTLPQDTQPGTNATGADSFAMEVPAPAVVNPSTSGDWLTESDQSCSPDTGSCQTTGTPDIPQHLSTVHSPTEGSITQGSPPCNPASCTDGYSMKCGRCLLVGPLTDLVNYSVAEGRCSSRGGGWLVMPKTLTDLQCVWNFYDKRIIFELNPWVGADDMDQPRQFIWNDGTPLPEGSKLWAQNEPSTNLPRPSCLQYNHQKLRAAACTDNQKYICQKDCI